MAEIVIPQTAQNGQTESRDFNLQQDTEISDYLAGWGLTQADVVIDDPLAITIRDMHRTKRKHVQQDRDLCILVKQRLAEDSPGVPVLGFYAYGYAGVALVQIFGASSRLTRFTDIGPMGHYDIKDTGKLAYELRMEGFNPVEDPNAAQLVELWSHRQKWADGLKTMMWGRKNGKVGR